VLIEGRTVVERGRPVAEDKPSLRRPSLG
jgi:hypothetical protein